MFFSCNSHRLSNLLLVSKLVSVQILVSFYCQLNSFLVHTSSVHIVVQFGLSITESSFEFVYFLDYICNFSLFFCPSHRFSILLLVSLHYSIQVLVSFFFNQLLLFWNKYHFFIMLLVSLHFGVWVFVFIPKSVWSIY